MKQKILVGLMVSSMLLGSAWAGTHAHEHGHDGKGPAMQLNAGKKWETDLPLRQSMGQIRAALATALPEIHHDRLTSAAYQQLAQQIEKEVGNIVSNCKLTPKADEQLHLVLSDVLAGSAQMAAPAAGKSSREGAFRVIGGLDNYARYFADPGFRRLKH